MGGGQGGAWDNGIRVGLATEELPRLVYTILDNKKEKFGPTQKTYKDEKIRSDLSLISGLEGWGLAVPFYFVKDCRILCVPSHQQLPQRLNAFCLPLKLQDSLAFVTRPIAFPMHV